jgi:uncharacterized membrane protein
VRIYESSPQKSRTFWILISAGRAVVSELVEGILAHMRTTSSQDAASGGRAAFMMSYDNALRGRTPMEDEAMRIASVGHAVFAATMIGLGILGLVKREWLSLFQPIPHDTAALAYFCALVCLATGIGLLWQSTFAVAARVLLVWLLLWLLLVRVPGIFLSFTVDYWWAVCKIAVMAAAAWVLYVWFATEWDRRLSFATGESGLRIARVLYGVALIPFGIAHFLYLQPTAALIPHWMPWHVALACFTGGAFIVAGLAISIGVCARLAAVLVALQIGAFTLLVWVPMVVAGTKDPFQWSETILSATLTAAAWVMADLGWRSSAPL